MPDDKPANGGAIHISEDVIVELVRKTIEGIPNIREATKLNNSSKFGISRKSGGIHVVVEHAQGYIDIDVYVLMKFGERIPDLAWDIQEKVKENLERYTGYNVRAVNVNVHGVYSESGDPSFKLDIEPEEDEEYDEED